MIRSVVFKEVEEKGRRRRFILVSEARMANGGGKWMKRFTVGFGVRKYFKRSFQLTTNSFRDSRITVLVQCRDKMSGYIL